MSFLSLVYKVSFVHWTQTFPLNSFLYSEAHSVHYQPKNFNWYVSLNQTFRSFFPSLGKGLSLDFSWTNIITKSRWNDYGFLLRNSNSLGITLGVYVITLLHQAIIMGIIWWGLGQGLWLYEVLCIPKCQSQCLTHSDIKSKEVHSLYLSMLWGCCTLKAKFFIEKTLWCVSLLLSFLFLCVTHKSLSSPCIHVKEIKVLLHKLPTTLPWTVAFYDWTLGFTFTWKNNWVPKCQTIWTSTAVLAISFKEALTTYALKIPSICWKHLHLPSLIWADCRIILCHLSRGGVPGRSADIIEFAFLALRISRCSTACDRQNFC